MKKILIVDDSATVRQQVGMALQQGGFGVLQAQDGVEGLELAGKPDVAMVICDVNMPRMNGLDMIEALRRDPRSSGLPVLMLTTERQPALVERAKRSGIKGWIIKPFKADLMLAAVKKLVGE